MKVFADVRNTRTEQIPTQYHAADPKNAAEKVKKQVARIRHARCASYRRTKRANDGYKACQNYGSSAVFFVKIVRSLQMTTSKKKRVFLSIDRRASSAANPVSQLVPDDCAENPGNQEPLEGHDVLAGEDSRGNQERIAGQKEAYEQPRFHKKNATNNSAKCKGSNPFDELFQAFRSV